MMGQYSCSEDDKDGIDKEQNGNGDKDDENKDVSAEIKETILSIDKFVEGEEKPLTEEILDMDEYTEKTVIENYIYNTKWQCTRKRYSAAENSDNFMLFDPLASVLWPGNLVQGNSIHTGVPNSIPISKRKKGNITLTMVSSDLGGTSNKYYRETDMALSTVTQAMNDILSGYTGTTVAKYNYKLQDVYSESQFAFSLGAEFSAKVFKTKADFSIDWSKKLSRVAVTLYQQYYTMAYDDPAGLEGVFTPDIKLEDVKYYTGNGNPMCYISSVTYGRIYVLLYESSVSQDSLKSALNFSLKLFGEDNKVNTKQAFNEIMKKTNVQIMQIGGNASDGLTPATAVDLDKIQEFLTKGANFDKNNTGAPLSYTVKYLKDASLVRMNSTLEYEVNQCVAVARDSAFVESDFNIFFDNITFDAATPYQLNYFTRLKIGTLNNDTNEENILWNSSEDFIPLGMGLGEIKLNITVPKFTMPNDPKMSFYINFETQGFYMFMHGFEGRIYFDYSEYLNKWVPRSNNMLHYNQFVQTLAIGVFFNASYNYQIKCDNKVLQGY